MNAIDFLLKEHQRVKQILRDISDTSHHQDTRLKMFDSLCQDLIRHETMEHKIWYPYFKNDHRLNHTIKHLLTEEKSAEKAIKKFDDIKSQEAWNAKFLQFKKEVEHHAEEEEQQLFPEVKKLLNNHQLEEIGKQMHHFKNDFYNTKPG